MLLDLLRSCFYNVKECDEGRKGREGNEGRWWSGGGGEHGIGRKMPDDLKYLKINTFRFRFCSNSNWWKGTKMLKEIYVNLSENQKNPACGSSTEQTQINIDLSLYCFSSPEWGLVFARDRAVFEVIWKEKTSCFPRFRKEALYILGKSPVSGKKH